jgi:hypothetical protein
VDIQVHALLVDTLLDLPSPLADIVAHVSPDSHRYLLVMAPNSACKASMVSLEIG